MFRLHDEVKVYVHRDAVDFRKSINGLAAIVEQSMKLDPFAQAVYVSCTTPTSSRSKETATD
nr:IS66 family insertion sequence element accessory protein TnpB [Burkholderia cenocepacia]